MNRDVANAELARLLDHRQPDVVVEKESLALRPPLGVGLPRGDRIACGELIHSVEIAGLIRIDAAVQQQPVRALHSLDDPGRRRCFLDRQRLALARRWNEREHDEIGIRIEKNVLDERVRTQALQIAESRRRSRAAALELGEALQRLRAGRQDARPCASGIHEVALHVEDEFLAIQCRARKLHVQGRLRRQVVVAATAPTRGVRRVHCEQRARRPAGGDEERSTRKTQVPGMLACSAERKLPRMVMHR